MSCRFNPVLSGAIVLLSPATVFVKGCVVSFVEVRDSNSARKCVLAGMMIEQACLTHWPWCSHAQCGRM